jgi:hypothetical protein
MPASDSGFGVCQLDVLWSPPVQKRGTTTMILYSDKAATSVTD